MNEFIEILYGKITIWNYTNENFPIWIKLVYFYPLDIRDTPTVSNFRH